VSERPTIERASLTSLFAPVDPQRVRAVFRSLATWFVAEHGKGRIVGALPPDRIQLDGDHVEVVSGPDDPAWAAPEGTGETAADWYVFGLLLHRVLSRGEGFPGIRTRNAPDPRDRYADAPDDLSALAMDLLLVDPEERCGVEDVVDVLHPAPARAEPRADWLEAALLRGGVVWARSDAAAALESLPPEEVLRFDVEGERLARVVRRADALTSVDRALASTLSKAPAALDGGAFQRAANLLARALVYGGIRVVVLPVSGSHADERLLALARAEPAPLWLVDGDLEPDVLRRLGAEEVPGIPPTDVATLPFAEHATERPVDELALLGVTAATTPWARMIRTWEGLRTPGRLQPRAADPSVDRAVFAASLLLVWDDFPRLAAAEAQLRRRAVTTGDVDGAWSAFVLGAWFATDEPSVVPQSDRGRAWQRLGRALRHALAGRRARVEQLLEGQLPLQAGIEEDAMATLLLAEASIGRARWDRARRLLGQLRVDARRHGREAWDQAAVGLLGRIGRVERPEVTGSGWLDLIWRRTDRTIALREGRLDDARRLAVHQREVVSRWPLVLGGCGAADRMWASRLAARRTARSSPLAAGHPAAPAWKALERAVVGRRAGDANAVADALEEAASRFEGANHVLEALACTRVRGLYLGGVRGGTLVEQADRALASLGVTGVPRVVRGLLPELMLSSDPPREA
jgi:hypothetical protein